MEHSSETLVIPKTEVDSNIDILPQTELDPETDVRFKSFSEMVLKNTALLIQPKLEFPTQNEFDPMLTPKLEPDVEVPSSVEPLLEAKTEPHVEPYSEPYVEPYLEPYVNPYVDPYSEPYVEPNFEHYVEPNLEPYVEPHVEPYVEPRSESASEDAAFENHRIDPTSVAQDEESNATYDDSDELPNLSFDGEETSASDQLPNLPVDGEETSGIDSQSSIAEAMETTSTTLVTEAISSPPPIPIAEEPQSTAAAEATAALAVAEVVDVESGWPPQVVDLTEEEGPADADIVEVLEVEQNVIYDGSVSRREERRYRRRRKRERREQRASNSNSNFSENNETIEINDVETDVEDDVASTSHLNASAGLPVTVDLAFTVPDSPLSPPPLRQAQDTNYDIPFMNNTQNQNMEIDFQDPNLLFGNLLGSPVLEHVDDGIPFLRPNSPGVFPMAQMGEQHPEQVVRPPSPELFNLIPMERPPQRRTRMATRNAAAAAAADRDRSRSPLGGGDVAAAAAADYAAFERLLAPLDYGPPPAGPPRRLMGVPDNSNMDMQHLHMHLPPQPQPHSLQHQLAAAAPIPPRQPSPPPRAGSLSCPICLDTLGSIQAQRRNLVSTVCGHVFCSHCLEESLKARKECPTCRKKLTKKQYHPIYI